MFRWSSECRKTCFPRDGVFYFPTEMRTNCCVSLVLNKMGVLSENWQMVNALKNCLKTHFHPLLILLDNNYGAELSETSTQLLFNFSYFQGLHLEAIRNDKQLRPIDKFSSPWPPSLKNVPFSRPSIRIFRHFSGVPFVDLPQIVPAFCAAKLQI